MPIFVNQQDINFWQGINAQVYEAFMLPLKIYIRDKTHNYDHVYNENINQLFEEPYIMPGYIPDMAQWQNLVSRFGIDETRDLAVLFSIELFKKKGKALPDIGDRIEIQRDLYKIMVTNLVDYSSNLQQPMTLVCTLHKVRPEEPHQGESVLEEY